MKAIICMLCNDIRGLPTGTEPVRCSCGNVAAWWTNPLTGQVRVYAMRRDAVRVLGLANSFLVPACQAGHVLSDQIWRELHTEATRAPGYLFDAAHRSCWAVVFAVGQSADVTWAQYPPADGEPTEAMAPVAKIAHFRAMLASGRVRMGPLATAAEGVAALLSWLENPASLDTTDAGPDTGPPWVPPIPDPTDP